MNIFMYLTPVFFLKALQIILLNLVLSGDNVGVIALAIKNLPPKVARKANITGVAMAIILRVFFILLYSVLLSITWLHVDLIGGLLLLYITYSMVKSDSDAASKGPRAHNGFLAAVGVIVLADLSMSLDNDLAIASVAIGGNHTGNLEPQEIALVVFGLLTCVPIIFFGSSLVSKLMNKHPIIVYICAGILVYTSVKMILGDNLISERIAFLGEHFGTIIAAVCGLVAAAAGTVYMLHTQKSQNAKTQK